MVYENDEFEYSFGLEPKLTHRPASGVRGEPRFVYAMFRTKDGGMGYDVMSVEDIRAHAKRFSKAYSNGPWQTNFEEMAKKTVLKRVLKYAPLKSDFVRAVAADETVKGIWCVPKYTNPLGGSYSDEAVRRLAALKPAARDFRIFWDNAYCVHDLYDETDELANIFDLARAAGTEDRVVAFASTSKITFPGAGISAIACSENSMKYMCKRFSTMIISYDKMNQLRHVRFLKNKEGVLAHMAKHRRRLVPCFDAVKTAFRNNLTPCGDIAHWTDPKGGYFISLYVMPGCAKRVANLCKEAGLTLTGAGSAYPYHKDPQDSHLRIAPTYPSLDEVETASELLCVCVRLAVVEKLLAEQA